MAPHGFSATPADCVFHGSCNMPGEGTLDFLMYRMAVSVLHSADSNSAVCDGVLRAYMALTSGYHVLGSRVGLYQPD